MPFFLVMTLVILAVLPVVGIVFSIVAYAKEKQLREKEKQYRELEAQVFAKLGILDWNLVCGVDEKVIVKSRQALENYDIVKFFKENKEKLVLAENTIKRKIFHTQKLKMFLGSNNYTSHPQYSRLENEMKNVLRMSGTFRIRVNYISSADNHLGQKDLAVSQNDINRFRNDPSLLMSKAEYNKYLKEKEKEALSRKHHEYYESVNNIIDYANENKNALVIKGSQERLDGLVAQLFDRTVNSIKRIKTIDSEEWDAIGEFVANLAGEIARVVEQNKRILEYYETENFLRIKKSCEALMSTQREFNEYIMEKVQAISQLFGTRVVRNETINEDEYNYIRPYKKTITPFTAEVSAAVFASAENNPLEYVVKYFYPDKNMYPEQIQKLHLLVQELETLKEAKQIIENHKIEYQQYLGGVPAFIMEHDEAGFFSRLGFANVDESVLVVEYKFTYTSGGGMAQRSFTIPMTEETIVALIKALESKLAISAFAKEQRAMMTKKLRDSIKERDNFTCCSCQNSVYKEPNLLLEIDHIIPVAKGGCTVEHNLQTLCWKCNRAKRDKILQ